MTRFASSLIAIVCSLAACQQDATSPDAAAAGAAMHPSFMASAFTQNTVFPIDLLVFIPCANGGLGEDVELTGNLHDLFHITSDGNGGFHVKTHDNPQGITGVGSITGATYHGTGVTQSDFNLEAGQQETDINNFRIIGQGAGNNFLVHDNFHVSVNANGVVTSFHDHFTADCK
jgi:hypothetical protein